MGATTSSEAAVYLAQFVIDRAQLGGPSTAGSVVLAAPMAVQWGTRVAAPSN